MSYKFQIHMSLMVQAIMLPLNLFDSPVMKKYLLGSTTSSTGGRLYNEVDSKPTMESITAAAAAASPAVTAAEPPRVEELPDEATPAAEPKKKSTAAAAVKTSSGADLD